MYTLADALRLKDHVLERWQAADKDWLARRRRCPERRDRRRRADGSGERRRPRRAVPQQLRQGLPRHAPGEGTHRAGRGVAETCCRCSSRTSGRTPGRRWRSEASRYSWVSWSRRSRRRGSLSSPVTVLNAHTLVWGAGLQANPLATSLGLELQRGNRVAVGDDLSIAGIRRCSRWETSPVITDSKTGDPLPQLGSVALQSGEHAGESIARRAAGQGDRAVLLSRQGHDGDHRPRGGGDPDATAGRTMKGKAAYLAWGVGPPCAPVHR